jgi:lipopolysaccharide export LptBFGC system permease protein LptF
VKIHTRYLIAEFLKGFFLFLFSFFFLYVAIDYCSHMQEFIHNKKINSSQIALYYGFQFIKRCDLLLPLAFMIAQMKILLSWNKWKELVAFQAGGVSWRALIRPLLLISLFLCLLNLCIAEFALPKSLRQIDRFYDAHLRHSHHNNRQEPLHILQLEDGSKLIYQYYDSHLEQLIDVIWIRSQTDLWRMKSLSAHPESPTGFFVDHLEKNRDGHFNKSASFQTCTLEGLKWDQQMMRRGLIPFENRSIRFLGALLQKEVTRQTKNELLTQLLFKLCMPLLCPLVALAVAPLCVRYQRQIPFFLLYSASLFGYVAFVAFMDAAVILGESGAAHPSVAIVAPFVLALSIAGPLFFRRKRVS